MPDHNLDRKLASQRLVGVFALGWLLFNMPLLALFDTDSTVFGIPLLYAYLFGAWALLVLLLAWLSSGKAGRGSIRGSMTERRD